MDVMLYENIGDLNLKECHEATLQWSADKLITVNGKSITQALKLMSELGELADNLAKGRSIVDDIGDCLVVLTNLAELEGLTIEECWNHALEDIKDRKGHLSPEGSFIKEGDVA